MDNQQPSLCKMRKVQRLSREGVGLNEPKWGASYIVR